MTLRDLHLPQKNTLHHWHPSEFVMLPTPPTMCVLDIGMSHRYPRVPILGNLRACCLPWVPPTYTIVYTVDYPEYTTCTRLIVHITRRNMKEHDCQLGNRVLSWQ